MPALAFRQRGKARPPHGKGRPTLHLPQAPCETCSFCCRDLPRSTPSQCNDVRCMTARPNARLCSTWDRLNDPKTALPYGLNICTATVSHPYSFVRRSPASWRAFLCAGPGVAGASSLNNPAASPMMPKKARTKQKLRRMEAMCCYGHTKLFALIECEMAPGTNI